MIRSRLVQHFVFHTGERGDVVVARSGWGKTTAIRDWIESAGNAVDVVWLNVEDDDSADTLWDRFTQAIDDLVESCRSPADGALTKSGFVVIDDLHKVQSPQFAARLSRFIASGPARLNVIITSQREPPSHILRLIDEGALRLTGETDLAFTEREVVQLMKERGMAGAETTAAGLLADTEGKPALVDRATR